MEIQAIDNKTRNSGESQTLNCDPLKIMDSINLSKCMLSDLDVPNGNKNTYFKGENKSPNKNTDNKVISSDGESFTKKTDHLGSKPVESGFLSKQATIDTLSKKSSDYGNNSLLNNMDSSVGKSKQRNFNTVVLSSIGSLGSGMEFSSSSPSLSTSKNQTPSLVSSATSTKSTSKSTFYKNSSSSNTSSSTPRFSSSSRFSSSYVTTPKINLDKDSDDDGSVADSIMDFLDSEKKMMDRMKKNRYDEKYEDSIVVEEILDYEEYNKGRKEKKDKDNKEKKEEKETKEERQNNLNETKEREETSRTTTKGLNVKEIPEYNLYSDWSNQDLVSNSGSSNQSVYREPSNSTNVRSWSMGDRNSQVVGESTPSNHFNSISNSNITNVRDQVYVDRSTYVVINNNKEDNNNNTNRNNTLYNNAYNNNRDNNNYNNYRENNNYNNYRDNSNYSNYRDNNIEVIHNNLNGERGTQFTKEYSKKETNKEREKQNNLNNNNTYYNNNAYNDNTDRMIGLSVLNMVSDISRNLVRDNVREERGSRQTGGYQGTSGWTTGQQQRTNGWQHQGAGGPARGQQGAGGWQQQQRTGVQGPSVPLTPTGRQQQREGDSRKVKEYKKKESENQGDKKNKKNSNRNREGRERRFNDICRSLKVKIVKVTPFLIVLFGILAMFMGFKSLESDEWMVNEIEYKKGNIKGKSVTTIGIRGISRSDQAYLKDGAVLNLTRGFMQYEDIIGENEDDEEEDNEKDNACNLEDNNNTKDTSSNNNKEEKDNKENGTKGEYKDKEDNKDTNKDKENKTKVKEGDKKQEKVEEKEEKTLRGKTKEQQQKEEEKQKKLMEIGMKADKKLKYYMKCLHETKFVKKSSCFRHMCEVGNLSPADTLHFKVLYGATFYDLHYKELPDLMNAGKKIRNLGFFSLVMLMFGLFFMFEIRAEGRLNVEKRITMRNLANILMVSSISMSILGLCLWRSVAGRSICVGPDGFSKPCEKSYGSITYAYYILFSILALLFYVVHSVVYKPNEEKEETDNNNNKERIGNMIDLIDIEEEKDNKENQKKEETKTKEQQQKEEDKKEKENKNKEEEDNKPKEEREIDKKDEKQGDGNKENGTKGEYKDKEDNNTEKVEENNNTNNKDIEKKEEETNESNEGKEEKMVNRQIGNENEERYGVVEIGKIEDEKTVSLLEEPDV